VTRSAPGTIVADLVARHPVLRACEAELRAATDLLIASIGAGGKLLVCGNGGSAAEAEHLVGDLMKSFCLSRPLDPVTSGAIERLGGRGPTIASALEAAIPAIALSSNGALLTAIGNDIGYEMVYAQQVHALGATTDCLMALSTSGRSPNVINAAHVGKALGLGVVAITGRQAGELGSLADVAIRVPEDDVDRIQDLHAPICHALAHALEVRFFADERRSTALEPS
jgi:D-sedoheptulose 7-phosphate isomerase